MKIKSYPGRAIEANDSLDKHGSMGLLYEANWTNANERINQTPLTTYSKSNVNISSLGKYQDQLERVKAYEADHQPETRMLRDFNGYKPSTLRIKKNPRQHNEWDNEPSKTKDVIHNPLYNHSQNNWHSSDYLTNLNNLASGKRADPKLRRSQTVIVKQPTSAASERHYRADVQGEIDLRDFYLRRSQLRAIEEKHQNKFPNMLSVHHEHGAANRIDANGIPKNCDTMSDNKVSLYHDHSTIHLSALARNHSDTVHNTSANRMNCYKASNFFVAPSSRNNVIGSNGELCENEMISNGKATARVLLNPLARNKSIKINHFDMVTTAKEPQKLRPEEVDGKLCDTNGKSGKKVSKKNSFSRIFATISAGSKFPRAFLGRGGGKNSQRAKLNLEELSENAESQQSNSSLSTLSSSPVFSPSNVEKKNATNRKHGSATSSDSDSFVIPRPRLIVPVHTYARKRRTGNLNSDQSISNTNGTNGNCDRSKGKKVRLDY
jgi:hypothetical protein